MNIEKLVFVRRTLQDEFTRPLRLTRLNEMDLMEHRFDIDNVCIKFAADEPRLTDEEIEECCRRLTRFAQDQFENRKVKEN